MRPLILCLFSGLVSIGFLLLLDTSLSVGSTSLPPLGKFLSPFTGFWQQAEPLGAPQGIQKIKGPNGFIEVVRDQRGVDHIFADNIEDLLFAQGYLEASQRLWELDIISRATGGMLAEIMGPDLIEFDKGQRAKGFSDLVERSIITWKKDEKSWNQLQHYINGINAYTDQLSPREYPLEFKLLNYAPSAWTPERSALVVKSLAQTLCFDNDDLLATNTLKLLGKENYQFLFPEIDPKQDPIIPSSVTWDTASLQSPAAPPMPPTNIGFLPFPLDPPKVPGIGSNNWAVSGDKTASGYPILCNDPHLSLNFPSYWIEFQLHCPELNAYGVSIPGVPGIIIGFNEKIAWGMTNLGHDLVDWHQIEWEDEQKKTYRLNGEVKQAQARIEEIRVKGQAPVLDTVYYSHWGPINTPLVGDVRVPLGLRWQSSVEPSPAEPSLFIQINQSENKDDFNAAISNFKSPPQNFVFASIDNDISLRVNGALPVRTKGHGRFISPGSETASGWKGYIPFEELPYVENPVQGYVTSANQRSTDTLYPYYYNGDFDHFRGRHANRRLKSLTKATPKDMMAIQNDNYSIFAEEAMTLMMLALNAESLNLDPSLIRELQKWDFRFEEDSKVAVVFISWWEKLYELTFDELLSKAEEMPLQLPKRWHVVQLLENNNEHPLFDVRGTPELESAADLINQAYQSAIETLRTDNQKGILEQIPTWANKKGTFIRHLARIDAFNSKPLSNGGFKEALNAMQQNHGPSWRMIVALGPEVSAFAVYPAGQSGNPGSPFYDNFLETWRKGQYYQIPFYKNLQEAKARYVEEIPVY